MLGAIRGGAGAVIDFGQLDGVLANVLRDKVDFADIYVEDSSRTTLRLEDERVDVVSSGSDYGAGLRLVSGETTLFAHTSDLSEAGLSRLGDEALSALRDSNGLIGQISTAPPEEAARASIKPASLVPIEEKAEMLWRADSSARSHSARIKQVTVSYSDSSKRFRIANSFGQRVEESRDYLRFFVQVVAAEGGEMQTGFDAPGSQGGFELFDSAAPEEVAMKAAERAILMLEAEPAPTGPMAVVLGPGSGGVIFHEAVGHGLEGDHIEKGSVYSDSLSQTVASPVVTLIDDSTIDGLWGSYAFDDEGEPSRRRVLIEDGVLKGFICDRHWGKRLGVGSSGSGRRESYSHPPVARMSNTFLQPGKAEHEEIIAETQKGILAKKLGGGQVDPQTGDFMFSVSEGYRIEGGKVTAPVRGATLTGNGPEVLKKVDMVGSDLGFDPGTCGKDGQGVPVCIGQPTCRVTEMTVGGTSLGRD